MKIVKLNRNFNIHKNHGFEVGLKFDMWDKEAQRFERAVANRLGNQAWAWKWNLGKKVEEDWAAGFGKRVNGEAAPYWIYLRKESMLTMLLLSLDH